MYKLVSAFIFISVFTGCTKPGDTAGSGNHKIYYDCYSEGIGPGAAPRDFESKRVCYDVEKDQVVWEKINEHIMSPGLAYSYIYFEYSKAFIKDDYLIKIFPAKDDPGNLNYYASGVFFEQINKRTGEIVISKKIINSTEFNVTLPYIMSKVITDGDNFIFGCNNGYIYCYDMNGNNIWKKANLPITDSDLGSGKASLFYDEKKLYFFSTDPLTGYREELYCLNTQTGETVWHERGSINNVNRSVFFDKKNVYTISHCSVSFRDKLTGRYVNSSPYITNCSSFNGKSIGSIDGVTAIIFSKQNEIGIIHVPVPDPMATQSFPDNPFNWNYFLEDGLVYGGGVNVNASYTNRFSFACYNYDKDMFNWKISYPLPSPPNALNNVAVFNYKPLNDEIYILANFHIENGSAKFNEIKPYAPPNNLFYNFIHPGVIVLDKHSGSIKKQIKKMPAGTNGAFVYNFCIE